MWEPRDAAKPQTLYIFVETQKVQHQSHMSQKYDSQEPDAVGASLESTGKTVW